MNLIKISSEVITSLFYSFLILKYGGINEENGKNTPPIFELTGFIYIAKAVLQDYVVLESCTLLESGWGVCICVCDWVLGQSAARHRCIKLGQRFHFPGWAHTQSYTNRILLFQSESWYKHTSMLCIRIHTLIEYVCMHTHINISQTSRIRSYSSIETKTLCMNHTEEEGGRFFMCVKIQFTRLPCPGINPQGSPVRGRSTPFKERLWKESKVWTLCASVCVCCRETTFPAFTSLKSTTIQERNCNIQWGLTKDEEDEARQAGQSLHFLLLAAMLH